MAYTHLIMIELAMIEAYWNARVPVTLIAHHLKRCRHTIYTVISCFKNGSTAYTYYQQYQANRKKCGRKLLKIHPHHYEMIVDLLHKGWSLITGVLNKELPYSASMLYRCAQDGVFDKTTLPWKGKRHRNGVKDKRGGRCIFRRHLQERGQLFAHYRDEFGHVEGDTIVAAHHKSCILTLGERQSKAIIALETQGRTACHIEHA